MDGVETDEVLSWIRYHSLSRFFQYAFGEIITAEQYQHNWHIDAMSEYLEGVYTGDIQRLVINIMPRSLKSALCSAAFPAWVMGRDPTMQFITCSYVRNLSTRNAIWTKLIMQSEWYKDTFPNTEIVAGEDQKTQFSLTKRGGLFSTAVNASVTGYGANIIVIDDPIDPKESLSDTVRMSTNQWIDTVLMSRLNNRKNDKVVLVMQRVHEDDVTGHLLDKGGWEHLSLPVYAHKKIIIDYGNVKKTMEKGEYLHEERVGSSEVSQIINELGNYAFAGQYMQHPVPVQGGEINVGNLEYYNPLDEEFSYGGMNAYILVDPANEKKKTSDYTAMVVIGLSSDNNYYLLDAVRDRLDPTERVNKLFEIHRKWNGILGKPPTVGYEKYGMMTDTHYIKHQQKKQNYRFSMTELGGSMKKEDRIRRLIPIINERRLYLPVNLLYTNHQGFTVNIIEDLVKGEMSTFPVSKHDDMLDALSRIEDMNPVFPMIKVKRAISVENMDYTPGAKQDSWLDF